MLTMSRSSSDTFRAASRHLQNDVVHHSKAQMTYEELDRHFNQIRDPNNYRASYDLLKQNFTCHSIQNPEFQLTDPLFRAIQGAESSQGEYIECIMELISLLIDGNRESFVDFLINSENYQIIWSIFPNYKSDMVYEWILAYNAIPTDQSIIQDFPPNFFGKAYKHAVQRGAPKMFRDVLSSISSSSDTNDFRSILMCLDSFFLYQSAFNDFSDAIHTIQSLISNISNSSMVASLISYLSTLASHSAQAAQEIMRSPPISDMIVSPPYDSELVMQELLRYCRKSVDSLCSISDRVLELAINAFGSNQESYVDSSMRIFTSATLKCQGFSSKMIQNDFFPRLLSIFSTNSAFKTKCSAMETLCVIVSNAPDADVVEAINDGFLDTLLDYFDGMHNQIASAMLEALIAVVRVAETSDYEEWTEKIYYNNELMSKISIIAALQTNVHGCFDEESPEILAHFLLDRDPSL